MLQEDLFFGKEAGKDGYREIKKMNATPFLKTTVGLGGVALMGVAAGTAKHMWNLKKSTKSKTKTLVKGALGVMVGIPLLKGISGMVNTY